MKTVLISGAGGFIAQKIARKFLNSGWRTVGISRDQKFIPFFSAVYNGYFMHPLKGVFERERIHAFLHCAYYSGRDEYEINYKGTILWAEQAKQKSVQHQIFLSSITARENSLSSYGRLKFALEKWFIAQNMVALRLGLVVGEGGMFGRIISMLKKYPALPLLDNGRNRVYLTDTEFLCDIIKDMVMESKPVPGRALWNLYQPKPVTMREVLEEIKKQYNLSCVFIPLPSGLILQVIRVLERLRFLKLGVSSNNIIGLRQNDRVDFFSDFSHFGYPELSLSAMVQKSKQNHTV